MFREEATFWTSEELPGVELLRAVYLDQSFPPHAHDTFALGVIEEGALAMRYRKSNFVAPRGSVGFALPGETHTGYAGDRRGWRYRMLYADPSLLCRVTEELGRRTAFPFIPECVLFDDELALELLRLHRLLEDSSSSPLELQTLLTWSLARLVLRHASDRPSPRHTRDGTTLAQRVRQILENRHAERISLEELAEESHTSRWYLLRTFRETFGMPPHTFLVQFRVRRARELLRSGKEIAETATAVGFCDQSHLTRAFHRIVGISPGRYVEGLRPHRKAEEDRAPIVSGTLRKKRSQSR